MSPTLHSVPISTLQYTVTHPNKITTKKISPKDCTYSHLDRLEVKEDDSKHYLPLDHAKRANGAGGKKLTRDQKRRGKSGEEEYGKLDAKRGRNEKKAGVAESESIGIRAKLKRQAEVFHEHTTVLDEVSHS